MGLHKMLKPGGTLSISVYSEAARQSVVLARDHVQRNAYDGANSSDIRQFRNDVRYSNNSLLAALQASSDFHSASGCRDLAFHVQEHRFNWLQLKQILDDLKLEVLEVMPLNLVG